MSAPAGGPVRRAAKAGSWYTADGTELRAELQGARRRGGGAWPLALLRSCACAGWLRAAAAPAPAGDGPVRAVIAPHAGYSYSGPTAAYVRVCCAAAWRAVAVAGAASRGVPHAAARGTAPQAYAALAALRPPPRRVVILGPSHHVAMRRGAPSSAGAVETPLGPLPVDTAGVEALRKRTECSRMGLESEEDEHSIGACVFACVYVCVCVCLCVCVVSVCVRCVCLCASPLGCSARRADDGAGGGAEMQLPYLKEVLPGCRCARACRCAFA